MHQNPSRDVSNASFSDVHRHCVSNTKTKTESESYFNIIRKVNSMINSL